LDQLTVYFFKLLLQLQLLLFFSYYAISVTVTLNSQNTACMAVSHNACLSESQSETLYFVVCSLKQTACINCERASKL